MRKARSHCQCTLKVGMGIIFFISLMVPFLVGSVNAWGNGGYNSDPADPGYGPHDYIAQHALDWLDAGMKQYLEDNLDAYLYGTELPDHGGIEGGIGDTAKHHIYFDSGGDLVNKEDDAAIRAWDEYNETLDYLTANDYRNAAKNAGIMTHYIADMGVFGHVMGKASDWDAEEHHSNYENYFSTRITSYISEEFDSYLVFDGSNDVISAYDAAVDLAYDTTFDDGGTHTCVWMDDHYDWDNTVFFDRAVESFNLAVNYVSDVLYTLAQEAGYGGGSSGTPSYRGPVVFSEVYYDTSGTDSLEEYIELYNPTTRTIDIGNWRISDNVKTYCIEGIYTIEPNTCFTIASDPSTFQDAYGKLPDKGDLSLALNNDGDQLTLFDPTGVEVDFVAWEGGYGNAYPSWTISANSGGTIQRDINAADTDTPADWSSNSGQDPLTQGDANPTVITETETNTDPTAIGGALLVGLIAGAIGGNAYGKKKKTKRK